MKNLTKLKNKLESLEKKEFLIEALNGALISFLILSCGILLFGLVETAANFSSDVRSVLAILIILSFVLSFLIKALIPLSKAFFIFNKPDNYKIARQIGSKFEDVKDDLQNALELIHEKNPSYSNELVDAAFEDVYKKIKDINLSSILDFSASKRSAVRFGSILTFTVILFFVFNPFREAAIRLYNYDKKNIKPPKFEFVVNPGNSKVTKGDPVEIKIKAKGDYPKEIVLNTKFSNETSFTKRDLNTDSSGTAGFKINSLDKSFEYFASAEEIASEKYQIEIVRRPLVTKLELEIIPPYYTGLPKITQKDNGNITTLKGSRINLNFESSKELDSTKVVFSKGKAKFLDVNGKTAGTSFSVYSDKDYHLELKDTSGIKNKNPIVYNIRTLIDNPPQIEMLVPNKNVKLDDTEKLELVVEISDDYGFKELKLNYRLSASKYEKPQETFSTSKIPIEKNVKESRVFYSWNLSDLALGTEDVVSYYLEVFDNDIISGPKSAKTKVFTLRVPSLDEIFAEADKKSTESQNDLSETFKKSEELSKELEELSNELKQKNKKISWEEKDKIESALKKFEEIEKAVSDVKEKLAKMEEELKKNNLLSEETMKKYEELQNLFKEMKDNDLLKSMRELQEKLKNMQRDKVQSSFEDFKKNEEYFKKSIERTMNLLKRIQVEQKTDEAQKRIDDLIERQKELMEKTKESDLADKEEREKSAQKQKDITKKLDGLEKNLDDLKEKMSDLKDMPKSEMDKIKQNFDKQGNQKLSESSEQKLQQSHKQQAMKNQQMLQKNMEQMKKQMSQMAQSMQKKNQVKTYTEMMKITKDLLKLSKEQEELKEETRSLASNSPKLKEVAQKQNNIKENLSRTIQNMNKLSQKSFAIGPEMGKSLGKARAEMNKVISGLQERSGLRVAQNQNSAMSGLNEAAAMMKNSMNMMMNSSGQGGQGGMMSMMQQLKKFSQQQMTINQMTQALKKQGNMSMQQQAQLQRLAEQQAAVRKSLQELNKEAKASGKSKSMAANLERILEEMREVVTGMKTNSLEDDLIKKQNNILSKLLDAQRSMNERDFEKNRRAFTGENIFRETPPEILLSTEEGKNKLREELLKAMKEGYLKDYEKLIKEYFEMLEKETKKE